MRIFVFSEEAKARPDSDEQEQLKCRLEKVEALNKTYEKTLKENAGHMLTVIEKMQKMVDQVKTHKFSAFHYFYFFFLNEDIYFSFYFTDNEPHEDKGLESRKRLSFFTWQRQQGHL